MHASLDLKKYNKINLEAFVSNHKGLTNAFHHFQNSFLIGSGERVGRDAGSEGECRCGGREGVKGGLPGWFKGVRRGREKVDDRMEHHVAQSSPPSPRRRRHALEFWAVSLEASAVKFFCLKGLSYIL